MEDAIIGIIAKGMVIAFGLVFFLGLFIWWIRRCEQEEPEQGGVYTPEESADFQCTTRKIRATVIECSCCAKVIGIKNPEAVSVFSIAFKGENGDIIKVNVPEEMYSGFDDGQTGILTLVNDELYSFEIE